MANRSVLAIQGTAQAAAVNGPVLDNFGRCGAVVVIDITAITAAPSAVFTLVGNDPITGKQYTILASAALTSVGTTVLRVLPSGIASANAVANDWMPYQWAVNLTSLSGGTITFKVGVCLCGS